MAFSFRESWLARQLHTPLVMLLTLPAGIALALWAMAPILALLERGYLDDPYAILGFSFAPDTARNVLAVFAGGAITALSLTYFGAGRIHFGGGKHWSALAQAIHLRAS